MAKEKLRQRQLQEMVALKFYSQKTPCRVFCARFMASVSDPQYCQCGRTEPEHVLVPSTLQERWNLAGHSWRTDLHQIHLPSNSKLVAISLAEMQTFSRTF